MARGDREREWKIGTVGAQVQNWRTISCGHARIRRNGGGGGGGGTRAAVVTDSGQEGANDGNGGREREPGSLVVASVAGIARYTALSQISYQSRFCLVSSSASFPFFREESSRTRI